MSKKFKNNYGDDTDYWSKIYEKASEIISCDSEYPNGYLCASDFADAWLKDEGSDIYGNTKKWAKSAYADLEMVLVDRWEEDKDNLLVDGLLKKQT